MRKCINCHKTWPDNNVTICLECGAITEDYKKKPKDADRHGKQLNNIK